MPKVGMAPIRTAQVTAAARRCLAERGFDGTTIRQIAAEAGVSTGTINHYFQNKEEALTAALLDVAREFGDGMKKVLAVEKDPWRRLVGFVEMSVPRSPQDVQNWLIWLEFWTQTSRRAELKKVHEQIYRQWRHVVARIIRDGVAAGQFQPCNADLVATTLVAIIDGAAVQYVIDDPGMSPETMHRLCVSYLTAALGKEDNK